MKYIQKSLEIWSLEQNFRLTNYLLKNKFFEQMV